jgi:FkbH-like protein
MEASSSAGQQRFVSELNGLFAREAETRRRLYIQDVHGLSSRIGLRHWFEWKRYFSYKIHVTVEASVELARSLNALVRAMYGKSRKVLVLDLDNTLWGGVIGDDGVEKIEIGRETPVAEAYTAFQEYCLSLRQRGVLLAVCSKNTESIAKTGFEHPSSVLKLEHFSSFKANWDPKHENILEIARELNLGVDSFVFVDDNPAEREIVRAQVPSVAVPEVGDDVTAYIQVLEQGRYFEPASLSDEDLARAAQYAGNAQRSAEEKTYANYGEYLQSLEMEAEIDAFRPVYMERIAQLTNKTNQFNVTTRRYTLAEIEAAAKNPDNITLYGRLRDKFGDNGLISVVLGHREGKHLHVDLWLMSCRVLKRDMEQAMLDELVLRAQKAGVETIYGYYLPTAKNGMVADLFSRLGFAPSVVESVEPAPGATAWQLSIKNYSPQNRYIALGELQHA